MASDKCPHCGAKVGPYDQRCAACGKGLGGAALLAPDARVSALPGSVLILVILAVVAGLIGLATASQATAGASIVAFGCLLAICARIVQAGAHHRDGMTRR